MVWSRPERQDGLRRASQDPDGPLAYQAGFLYIFDLVHRVKLCTFNVCVDVYAEKLAWDRHFSKSSSEGFC